MSNPAPVHITGYQNSIINRQFLLTDSGSNPFDLSGYSVYAQVRSRGRLVLDLAPFVTGDTASGDIRIEVTDETMSGVPVGCYGWDMLLEDPDGDKFKIIEGDFLVKKTYTLQ